MSDQRPPRVSCTRWACRPHRPCRHCRRSLRDTAAPEQRAWFQRTRHCGTCGQPGNYCRCTQPCACADLHPVGSGLRDDALDQFAETPISTEQGDLFA